MNSEACESLYQKSWSQMKVKLDPGLNLTLSEMRVTCLCDVSG